MGEGRTSGNRVSVYEAAEAMGVTVDAIRKRISRGTIPHERDDDGRVWVLLDTDQDAASKVQDTDQPQSDVSALISAKDETIEALRGQLEEANERDRENRRIIAALTSRIPAIEAPQEATEAAETVEEAPERSEPHSATGGAQEDTQRPRSRPWWQRIIGG
jgi:chromosome segregation ATPase